MLLLPTEIYTQDISAWRHSDYITIQNPTLTFEPNFLSQDVMLTVASGLDVDRDEYFQVCFTNQMDNLHVSLPVCTVMVVQDEQSGGK